MCGHSPPTVSCYVIDHPPHRQRRANLESGSGHEGVLNRLLPSRLFRFPCRDSHPCFGHQPTYLDCGNRGVWHVEYEVLP